MITWLALTLALAVYLELREIRKRLGRLLRQHQSNPADQ